LRAAATLPGLELQFAIADVGVERGELHVVCKVAWVFDVVEAMRVCTALLVGKILLMVAAALGPVGKKGKRRWIRNRKASRHRGQIQWGLFFFNTFFLVTDFGGTYCTVQVDLQLRRGFPRTLCSVKNHETEFLFGRHFSSRVPHCRLPVASTRGTRGERSAGTLPFAKQTEWQMVEFVDLSYHFILHHSFEYGR
jgi:hypothetical protein